MVCTAKTVHLGRHVSGKQLFIMLAMDGLKNKMFMSTPLMEDLKSQIGYRWSLYVVVKNQHQPDGT